jgi:hypothetical protein
MSGHAPTPRLRCRSTEPWFGLSLLAPAMLLSVSLLGPPAGLLGNSPDDAITDASEETIGLRVTWVGPVPQNYHVRLTIAGGRIEQLEPLGLLPTSGLQLARDGDRAVSILPAGAAQFGGVDVWVRGDDATRLELQLTTTAPAGSAETDRREEPLSWTLEQLRNGATRHRLDNLGNQLVIERHPGDRLQLAVSPQSSVFDPQESISVQLRGHRTGLSSGRANLEMELLELPRQRRVERRSWSVQIDSAGSFPPVPLLLTTPDRPGVYQVNWRLVSPRSMTQLISGGESLQRSWQWVVAPRKVEHVDLTASLPRASWEPKRSLFPKPPSGLAPLPRDWLPWPTPWIPDWNRLGGRLPTVSTGPWQGDPAPPMLDSWVIPPSHSDQQSLGSFEPGQLQRLLIEVDAHSSGEWNLMLYEDGSEATTDTPLIVQRLQLSALACYSEKQSYTHQLSWYAAGGPYRVVLSNLSEMHPLTIHQLRVEQARQPTPVDNFIGPDNLNRPVDFEHGGADSATPRPNVARPWTAATSGPPQRLISLYVPTPLLAKTFGAQETLDPLHQQPLEDWNTFWTAGQRLVQHARRGGYNCLTLTIAADGAAIYPTKVLPNTGRFDGGRFFSDGRDAFGKDLVELILRLAGHSGLRVILAIDLNVPLFPPPSATGRAPAGPNPLDPAVQAQLERLMDELVERYAEHPAWAGVAMVMNARTELLFEKPESGWESELLARFATDQQWTEQLTPIAEEPRQVANWFAPPERRQAWLSWRSQRMADQHHRLAQRLRRQRADLVVQLLLDHRLTETGTHASWLDRGLDQKAYRGSDSVFCLSYGNHHAQWPEKLTGENWLLLAGESRPWQGRKEASFGRPPEPLEGADAWQHATASRLASKSGIGEALRRGWLQTVNEQLPIHWLDNVYLPPGGDPELTADIRHLLSRLPAIEMKNVSTRGTAATTGGAAAGDRKRPLTSVGVHCGSDAQATYLLLINTAPWPERLTLHLQTSAAEPVSVDWLPPAPGSAEAVASPPAGDPPAAWHSWVRTAGYRPARETSAAPVPTSLKPEGSPPQQIRGNQTWEITLPPYGARLAQIGTPELRVTEWRCEAQPEYRLRVRQQQDEFQRSIQQLAGQPRRFAGPVNADFTQWTRDGHPLGWTSALAPQAEIRPGSGFDHRPATAVQLVHRGGAGTCWLQSGAFTPPTTGRLAVALRMAPGAASPTPPAVLISLEVRDATGQRFWLRQTYAGGPATGVNERRDRDAKTSETGWQEPLFRFELPGTKQPIVSVRLGIDLQAEGELLIDRVQLFDRFLSPEERRGWQNQLFLTNRDLEEGILESTLRLQERWTAQQLGEFGTASPVTTPTTLRSVAAPPRR